MPLNLYNTWLPMRIYGGSVSNGPILPAHLAAATYPSRPSQMSQHLNFGVNHTQGVLYPNHHVTQRDNNLTDSEDDGSTSPASPNFKSQGLKKKKKKENLILL